MKRYEGRRKGGDVEVTVNGLPLNPRFDLRSHSPIGFEWGYSGSGPAQLALALLADQIGSDNETLMLYQDFKRTVVARLPLHAWTLTSQQIWRAIEELKSGLPVSFRSRTYSPRSQLHQVGD